jgi:CheY-like chemotaxis protein
MQILVALHDRWARLVLARALSQAGFGVAEASNGISALRLAAQTRPDVVVLGGQLPELGVGDVRRALKADPLTRGIGVFVMRDHAWASGQPVAASVRACPQRARSMRARRHLTRQHVPPAVSPQSHLAAPRPVPGLTR